MIYTSYFANWRKFPKESTVVAICRLVPPKFKGYQNEVIAPSLQLLRSYKYGFIDMELFKPQYFRELEESESLGKLSGFVDFLKLHTSDIVLVCYEKHSEDCHRSILSEFLNREFGLSIKEL